MKLQILSVLGAILLAQNAHLAALDKGDGEQLVHFNFQTENGQYRSEDIMFNNTKASKEPTPDKNNEVAKPVEYRGGYSFISADGYEYMVFYKANKNGFQPYVTARKIKDDKSDFIDKNVRFSKHLREENINKNERRAKERENISAEKTLTDAANAKDNKNIKNDRNVKEELKLKEEKDEKNEKPFKEEPIAKEEQSPKVDKVEAQKVKEAKAEADGKVDKSAESEKKEVKEDNVDSVKEENVTVAKTDDAVEKSVTTEQQPDAEIDKVKDTNEKV